MKKIKIINTITAFLAIISMTSCSKGPSIYDLKLEFATKRLSDDNYQYEHRIIQGRHDFTGDYYATDTNYYTSVFNRKSINTYSPLRTQNVGTSTIYVDQGDYFIPAAYYDSFGNQIDALDGLTSVNNFKTDYMIVAKDSSIYEYFDGLDASYKGSKELKILERTYLDINETIFLIKEFGDTHFYAHNVVNIYDIKLENYVSVDNVANIQILNDSEYRGSYGDVYYRVKVNSKSNQDTPMPNLIGNVIQTPESNNSDPSSEYYNYITINFADSLIPFTYGVKEVTGISNDFDFVYEGKKYDAIASSGNLFNEHPNYVLFRDKIITSKNNTYAVALGKKILADGVLSNTNYTFVIDNKNKIDEGTKDTSIFEGNRNIIFNGKLESLDEDETLLILTDKLKVTKEGNKLNIINLHGTNFEERGNYELTSYSSINDLYMFKILNNESSWNYNYCFLNKKTGELINSFREIDRMINNRGIYIADQTVYVGLTRVVNIYGDYTVGFYSNTIFGRKDEIIKVSYDFDSNYNSTNSSLIRLILDDKQE